MAKRASKNGYATLPLAAGRKLEAEDMQKLSEIASKLLKTNTDSIRMQAFSSLTDGTGVDAAVCDVVDHAFNATVTDVDILIAERLENNGELTKPEILQYIKDGRFGMCAICNSEIPPERVEVMPMKPVCVKCQKENESTPRTQRRTVKQRWKDVRDEVEEPDISFGYEL